MADAVNPVASHHLPSFITAPGDSDVLMIVMSGILLISVLGFGLVFFRLHTLPERMAHKSKKVQFEIVAVLGLIALFTHMHIFWVAGLLLAFIDIPDFGGALNRIAGSTEKLAGLNPGEGQRRTEQSGSSALEDSTALPETSAGNEQVAALPSPKLVPVEGDAGHA